MFSQERNLAALEDMPVPTVKGPPLEADQSCFSVSVGERLPPVLPVSTGYRRLPTGYRGGTGSLTLRLFDSISFRVCFAKTVA